LIIKEINLINYRNLLSFHTKFENEGMIITGKNGSGKTNLLEAISYFAIGKSFRTSQHNELVNFKENAFRIEGTFFNKSPITISCINDKFKRLFEVNGQFIRNTSELYEYVKVILFSPEDIDLIDGTPKCRRSFLDQSVTQYELEYLHLMKRFFRVLKQRNALLKELPDQKIKRAWDEQFVVLSYEIIRKRRKYIELLTPFLEQCYNNICDSEKVTLNYVSTMKYTEDEGIFCKNAMNLLNQNFEREVKLQRSLEGPHLDDIEFSLNNKPAKNFASHGQKRSIAIALKLSHSKFLESNNSDFPILMFDDIFADLDKLRSKRIYGMISDKHQVFVATPAYDQLNYFGLKELNIEKI